jgi:hypothetical protein
METNCPRNPATNHCATEPLLLTLLCAAPSGFPFQVFTVLPVVVFSNPICKEEGVEQAPRRELTRFMDDAVRPSAETFQHYYERGYRTWQRLYRNAGGRRGFPSDLVNFEDACHQHPYLHSRLDLKPGYNFHVTGTSAWLADNGNGPCHLPAFQRTYSIPVTARRPIAISIEPSPEPFPTWFGSQSNHVCILTLAWAYVLAARWADIVPGATPLEYTDSCAVWNESGTTSANGPGGAFLVDLGPVSDGAARWWAAILAPNQGWITGIRHEADLLTTPWSTDFGQTETPFLLSRDSAPPVALSAHRPPSFGPPPTLSRRTRPIMESRTKAEPPSPLR